MDHRLFVGVVKTVNTGGETVNQRRVQDIAFPATTEQRGLAGAGEAAQRRVRDIDAGMSSAT